MEIQSQMTERALELLALPSEQPCMVLDIGCGSGLSGECLDEQGHFWYELQKVIFHRDRLQLYIFFLLYTVGRPVIRKVLKIRIWGVPQACLGSR